jgi:hypothetical protein
MNKALQKPIHPPPNIPMQQRGILIAYKLCSNFFISIFNIVYIPPLHPSPQVVQQDRRSSAENLLK